ncbi:MAG: hypothetical protein KKG76_07195 [Euryarchaeota archaeon]|nr:hypothetical protein [Euryarchaeota archaeon]
MTTRAADATIKGYYYQFDTSILKLLELPTSSDSVIIEGIEDIDINTATETTTVQCKYLSKPRFINSVVRDPIALMLDHFVNPATPSDLKYVLYAHFESETPGNEPIIDLTKLKEILTYTENKVEKHFEIEKNISDAKLNAFLSQFKLTFGTEFYTQQKQVIDKLKSKFTCSEFEADTHFYNNALRIVIDKAIKTTTSQREITKAEFISGIDCRKQLFNEWFIKLRSKKDYLKLIAQNLKSTRALDPPRTKVIVIGKNIIAADNLELPLKSFLEILINKYYKLNSSLRNAKPLTIVLECDSQTLLDLKKHLIDKEIIFNDGFEEIKFSSNIFNQEPIINKTNNGAKILKSSYLIKVISKETLMKNISSITSPSVLINFSKNDISNRFSSGQFFDFQYCENLKDVFKLLAP